MALGLIAGFPASLEAQLIYLVGTTVVLAGCQLWCSDMTPRDFQPSFYICLILGGAIASSLMAFAVPVALNPALHGPHAGSVLRTLFHGLAPEFLILLVVSAVLVSRSITKTEGLSFEGAVGGVAIGLVVSLQALGLLLFRGALSSAAVLSLCALALGMILVRDRRSVVAALCAGLVVSLLTRQPSEAPRLHVRSQYGQLLVVDSGQTRSLRHGTTLHGSQDLACIDGDDEKACDTPTTYYASSGPAGLVIRDSLVGRQGLDIGVVGLGAGTLAAYCASGITMSFFELDPTVEPIARRYFRFVRNGERRCREFRIVTGDARMTLRGERDHQFDLLVLDAFSSDAVPAHLLTREAVAEFNRVLRNPNGRMAFHVSSRHFPLAGVVAASAKANGLYPVLVTDAGGSERPSSAWVVVTRTADQIVEFRADATRMGLRAVLAQPGTLWTDQRHSLIELFLRSRHAQGGGLGPVIDGDTGPPVLR
jgi:SAM-dependent methyltransferase